MQYRGKRKKNKTGVYNPKDTAGLWLEILLHLQELFAAVTLYTYKCMPHIKIRPQWKTERASKTYLHCSKDSL